MPQVFFNTDTFKPDSFPVLTDRLLQDISWQVCAEHPEMARKISPQSRMYMIPGFMEALHDGFLGWHLHHVAGESIPMKELRKARLYERRPWWELRFMRHDEHRRIHSDPDIFYSGFYGM